MTDDETPLIWVLADDRAGNVSQGMGVAEAMGYPFHRINIGYTGWARLPNIIRGKSLLGVDGVSRRQLVAPWPDLVIAAGRRTAPVARWIKAQSGGKTRLCQIMRPDSGESDFDLIAVPEHDRMPAAANVIETSGAAHRISETTLLLAENAWRGRFNGPAGAAMSPSAMSYVALIIGGSTKKTTFDADMCRELTSLAIAAARQAGAKLLVTTSRRTGTANEEIIAEMLGTSDVPYHLHDWHSKDGNPYFGYLALSDVIIVTGDSVSMCCEAAAARGGVYIYAPPGLAPARHQRLHQSLYQGGYARPLVAGEMPVAFAHPSLQPARLIARRCLEILAAGRDGTM